MHPLDKALNATFRPNGPTDKQRAQRNAIARAKRLAAKYRIRIDREPYPTDYSGWWVWLPFGHPDHETERDPLDGGHFCTHGDELEEAVRVYVQHIRAAKYGN